MCESWPNAAISGKHGFRRFFRYRHFDRSNGGGRSLSRFCLRLPFCRLSLCKFIVYEIHCFSQRIGKLFEIFFI